jgi:hypothetical protein
MKEILFPSMLTMDHPGLITQALDQCMNVPYGERLNVNLTETQRISSFGVAALGARIIWLLRAKRLPSGSTIRRPENGRLSNDLMRMGLYNLLQEASEKIYTQDVITERPQELWLVDRVSDLDNACRRLISLLRTVLPATEKDFERVQEMMFALGENVFRHGQSNTGAMLCGQAYPKNGWIEFAVADTGQGVWSSLKRIPSLMQSLQGDAHAILTALTLKVAQKDGTTRPGTLSKILATARQTGGEFVILSGEASLAMRRGEMKNQAITYFPGTVIGVRLRLLREGSRDVA